MYVNVYMCVYVSMHVYVSLAPTSCLAFYVDVGDLNYGSYVCVCGKIFSHQPISQAPKDIFLIVWHRRGCCWLQWLEP